MIESIFTGNIESNIRKSIENIEVNRCCQDFAMYLDKCENNKELPHLEKEFYDALREGLDDFVVKLMIINIPDYETAKKKLEYIYLNGYYGIKERDCGEEIDVLRDLESNAANCRAIQQYMNDTLDMLLASKEEKATRAKICKQKSIVDEIEKLSARIEALKEEQKKLKEE